MRRFVAGLAILTALAVGHAPAGATGEQLIGVVTPTIGVEVDRDGHFSGTGGTQPATVTTEERNGTLIVTVTPSF